MRSSRFPLLLGALLCSHGLLHAQVINIINYSGVDASNFDALYQTVPEGLTKTFVRNPTTGINKGFVQLSLSDQNQGQPQSALIQPKNVADPTGANAKSRWYGFSVYLPTDWDKNGKPITFAEIVSSNSNLPAPVSLFIDGEDLKVTLSANHLAAPTAATTQQRTFTLTRAVPGKWHCVYMWTVWSGNLREGSMRIWVNGEGKDTPAYEAFRTHNAYQNVTLTPRVGLTTKGALGTPARTVIVDGVILGNPSAKASEFQDHMPCPIPTT